MAPPRVDNAQEKLPIQTDSGIVLEQCYGPGKTNPADIGEPGQFPFTRGIQPTMYRGKLWTMRQYAGFGSAAETNRRFKYLLDNGQTGLSVAFDLPTQMGLDSDHSLAAGEVGKVGVAIDTLHDMEVLLSGIPLNRVSTSMTINATAAILLAMYVAVAKKQNASAKEINGTVQNDILKEYIARGTYIYPPRFSLRLITDIFAYCQSEVPNWNTISISGYHIREAGSTAAQELAFTFGNAIAYVEAARERGLHIDSFGPRLSFFFNAHNDFLEEIAKFRAARRIWAKLAKHRFAATNPRSMMLRFHAQTAGSSLTAQQPDNNVVRVTLQALAAVLGGAQSLHTNSKDEALSLPTEEAARLALRTQQIIAYESGVTKTVDPLGGSYAIEALTDSLEAKTFEYLEKIDSLGGMLPAIEAGWVQREIQNAAYDYQKSIETKQRIVVGVNGFRSDTEYGIPIHTIDPALETEQVQHLQNIRTTRDASAASASLERLDAAARTDQNLMPHILAAVEAYASIGEISDVFRRVHGEFREALGSLTVLEVRNLKTHFFTGEGIVKAVDDVSFVVERGKTLGLVGESGCGKSVTAMSVSRLISPPGRLVGGEILFEGRDLARLSEPEMRRVRGAKIAMIFQEPMTALNPVLTAGFQVAEAVLAHEKVSRAEAWLRAVDAMRAVSIPDAEIRARDYPHQLSGGMRQRIMIAMALVCNPTLLIADEPTTALDVTIQAQILELLDSLRQRYQLSVILISHDLGAIAEVADTVAVMYAGKIVEMAPAMELFHNAKHPYTQGLLRSIPKLASSRQRKDKLEVIEGMVPSLLRLPRGCAFEPRCFKRTDECTRQEIPPQSAGDNHEVRCIHA